MKNVVVIGFLGTQLDAGLSGTRWDKWRPTVDVTRHEHLLVSRLVLLYDLRHQKLLEQVQADIAGVSPETQVLPQLININDPWDFGEVYAALFDFAQSYAFNTEQDDYLIHLTTGTHVAQICLFLMVEARYIPAILIMASSA